MFNLCDHLLEISKLQKIHREAEEAFMSPVVMVLQKIMENPGFFMKLRMVGVEPYLLCSLLIPFLVPMADEGVKNLYALISCAGIGLALEAVFSPIMVLAASSYRTGLVAGTATAAGAVVSDMHGAQDAVEPAEGK